MRRPAASANGTWSIPGKRGDLTLVAGGLAVGFSDGFLSAVKVADGSLVEYFDAQHQSEADKIPRDSRDIHKYRMSHGGA